MSGGGNGDNHGQPPSQPVPLFGPPVVFRAKKKPPELSPDELEAAIDELTETLDPSLDDLVAFAASPLPDLATARAILEAADKEEAGWDIWKAKKPKPKKSKKDFPPINPIFEARRRLAAFRAEHPGPVKLRVHPASGLILDREGRPVPEGESLLAAIETVRTAAPRKKRRAAATVAPSLTASAKPPRRSLRVRWRGLRK